MANMVKMCDMSMEVAAKVLQMLNPGKVEVEMAKDIGKVIGIVSVVEPKELNYPEGWYYAKGHFTNKHNSTTGTYESVLMFNESGELWEVPYCTAD